MIQTFGLGCLQPPKRKDDRRLYKRCYQACILNHLLMFSRCFILFQRNTLYLIWLEHLECIYLYNELGVLI